MTASTFNAITYANKLKKAKDSNERADIEAEELSNIINSQLATKQDLQNLKNEIVIRLGSLIVAGIVVLGLIIKL